SRGSRSGGSFSRTRGARRCRGADRRPAADRAGGHLRRRRRRRAPAADAFAPAPSAGPQPSEPVCGWRHAIRQWIAALRRGLDRTRRRPRAAASMTPALRTLAFGEAAPAGAWGAAWSSASDGAVLAALGSGSDWTSPLDLRLSAG